LDEIWDLQQTFIDTVGDIILAAIIIYYHCERIQQLGYDKIVKYTPLVQKNLYVLGFIGHISVQRKYAPFYLK
jgi:hypothetical protein